MTTEITTALTEAVADTVTTAAESAVDTVTVVADTVTTAAGESGGLINVGAFLDTLPMMAKGMLGIFAVTAVIIAAIYLLGLIKGRDK